VGGILKRNTTSKKKTGYGKQGAAGGRGKMTDKIVSGRPQRKERYNEDFKSMVVSGGEWASREGK